MPLCGGMFASMYTSDVLEHKWWASLKLTIVKQLICTSNTQATKKKLSFFNYVYTVKGFQCHSNYSPQLFELKGKKQQQNKSRYLNFFFVIFFAK